MKPTPKQLNYLRALAQRTSQTFTWPKTMEAASDEIERRRGDGVMSAVATKPQVGQRVELRSSPRRRIR